MVCALKRCICDRTWFWINNLTLSIGAATVFEITAAAPDNAKFSSGDNGVLFLPMMNLLGLS